MSIKKLGSEKDRIAEWIEAIRRVRSRYQAYSGRPVNLLRPLRYTEKVQWRKLFDLDPRYSILCDKLAVREFIAQRVGSELLTPLLWAGDNPDAVPFETLSPPYVVKSTHASGQILRVADRDGLDVAAARTMFVGWLALNYGVTYDEPAYGHVPPRLMVERRVTRPDGSPPVERKVWVFGGRVRLVQTLLNEGDRNRHAAFHDPAWQRREWYLLSPPNPGPFPPPAHLDDIVSVAERLGAGFDHVRVDFYDTDDRLWIGEMTVYPYGGIIPFTPDQADYELGSYWRLRRPLWRALGAVLWSRHEIPRPDTVH